MTAHDLDAIAHLDTVPLEIPLPCAEDPEMWFPAGTTWDNHRRQADQAKAACRRCPLIEPCLKWALDTREKFAIAGGMTPRERRKLLNRPATTTEACGTRRGYEQHRRRGEKPCAPCRAAASDYSQRQRDGVAS